MFSRFSRFKVCVQQIVKVGRIMFKIDNSINATGANNRKIILEHQVLFFKVMLAGLCFGFALGVSLGILLAH